MKTKRILVAIVLCFALVLSSALFFACDDNNCLPPCDTPLVPPPIAQTIETVKHGVVEVLTPSGRGSGTIIDKIDGNLKILTNLHTIRPALVTPPTVQIRFYQEHSFVTAFVIGYAPNYDLAVISSQHIPERFHIFEFNYYHYQAQQIFALGYLTGIGTTSPLGTFSVLDGIIVAEEINFLASNQNFFAIPATASIRGGISGGALIDAFGRLVGVPTWGYIHGGHVMPFGISYSIPSVIASAIADRIMASTQDMARIAIGFFINLDGRISLNFGGAGNAYIRVRYGYFYKHTPVYEYVRIHTINGYSISSVRFLLAQIIRTMSDTRFG